jgi:hypothetical protein
MLAGTALMRRPPGRLSLSGGWHDHPQARRRAEIYGDPAMTDNIISFQSAAPSARFRKLDTTDAGERKRQTCQHRAVLVWSREPVLECKDCGGIVDPYQWIRDRVRDWENMISAEKYKVDEIKRESEQLKKALRFLRKEFADEREKYEAEHAVATLPPKHRIRL